VVCFGRFWVVCLVGGLYLGIPPSVEASLALT